MNFVSYRQAVLFWLSAVVIGIYFYNSWEIEKIFIVCISFVIFGYFFVVRVNIDENKIHFARLFFTKEFSCQNVKVSLFEKNGPGVGNVFFILNQLESPKKQYDIFLRCKISYKSSRKVFEYMKNNNICLDIEGSDDFKLMLGGSDKVKRNK